MPATNLANVRSRQQWAEIINADWRKSIDSIIQTGRDLAAAKAELAHGEFLKMVADDLPFSRQTAHKLVGIAQHPSIANVSPARHLPPSWAVLSELTSLSAEDFADAQDRGLITADTGKREARAVTGAYKAPAGATVGDTRKPSMLPAPQEARKIAEATGRLVAASDGKLYTGATAEEEGQYVSHRREAFSIREAIERIGDCDQSAGAWLADTEPHWLHDFRLSAIDDAIAWLGALKEAMEIVDA